MTDTALCPKGGGSILGAGRKEGGREGRAQERSHHTTRWHRIGTREATGPVGGGVLSCTNSSAQMQDTKYCILQHDISAARQPGMLCGPLTRLAFLPVLDMRRILTSPGQLLFLTTRLRRRGIEILKGCPYLTEGLRGIDPCLCESLWSGQASEH